MSPSTNESGILQHPMLKCLNIILKPKKCCPCTIHQQQSSTVLVEDPTINKTELRLRITVDITLNVLISELVSKCIRQRRRILHMVLRSYPHRIKHIVTATSLRHYGH